MNNRKPHLLLVENDEFTRYMMREVILALGVEVEIATDGREGVELLQRRPDIFDLVLMDLHMPELSGVEATRMIRETTRLETLPIIAITADAAYHDDSVVQELGLNGFASKPVTPGQLLTLIERFCKTA